MDTSDDLVAHVYRGGSMQGTFRRGDCIPIEPVPLAAIRPGDVVVFHGEDGQGESKELVHRVVGVRPGGLVTRGDNSRRADGGLVTAEALQGRVTYIERDGRRLPIQAGRIGLLRARLLHARIRVWTLAIAAGRGPYRWLRASGLVRRLWRPQIIRLRVATDRGPLVKYVSAGRTVARWWPAEGRFECQRPYDLVFTAPDDQSQIK